MSVCVHVNVFMRVCVFVCVSAFGGMGGGWRGEDGGGGGVWHQRESGIWLTVWLQLHT